MPTPTPDEHSSPQRRTGRRPLGRGPGAGPPAAEPAGAVEAAEEPYEPGASGEGAGPTPVQPREDGGHGQGGPRPAGSRESARQGARPERAETETEPDDHPGTAEDRDGPRRESDGSEPGEPGAPRLAEEPNEPVSAGVPEPPVTADPASVEGGAPQAEPAEDGGSGPGGDIAEAPGTAEVQGFVGAEGAAEGHQEASDGQFRVRLENFEGPFDLLLQLISKHQLDVTEVALSRVTDEFMDHIHAMGSDWDLDQTTEFLVVAATLLDLKTARLLPTAEVEDETDLALLEARDLLFARLLQYRAYKQVAEIFAGRLAEEARRHPRTVGLEPHHAELLPEVVFSVGPEGFARLAAKAMQPKPEPQVYVEHIHAPLVSVREQAEVVIARLRAQGRVAFRELTEDAPDTLTVVARFLALLELYRERAVDLDQEEALGDITVGWSGGEQPDSGSLVTGEFDDEAGAQQQDQANRQEEARR